MLGGGGGTHHGDLLHTHLDGGLSDLDLRKPASHATCSAMSLSRADNQSKYDGRACIDRRKRTLRCDASTEK